MVKVGDWVRCGCDRGNCRYEGLVTRLTGQVAQLDCVAPSSKDLEFSNEAFDTRHLVLAPLTDKMKLAYMKWLLEKANG